MLRIYQSALPTKRAPASRRPQPLLAGMCGAHTRLRCRCGVALINHHIILYILLGWELGGANIITNSLTQISKIKNIDDFFYTFLGVLGAARAQLEQVQ